MLPDVNWARFNCENLSKVFVCPQGIQMTATTPSMRAVRFETGLIELELSNRIQCKTQPGGSSSYLKLFGKCQVDLNLALGQIVKHQVQISLLTCCVHCQVDNIIQRFSLKASLHLTGLWRSWIRLPPGGILPNSNRSAKCTAGGNQWLLRQGGRPYNTQQAHCFCSAGGLWQRFSSIYFPLIMLNIILVFLLNYSVK